MLTAHAAPVVLTLTGPPLRDGAVVVQGDTVVAVGPASEVVPDGARLRRHDGVLLPGLVNAATRLEGPSDDGPAREDAARLVEARGAVHALLQAGTTCVADVVTHGAGVRAAALAGLAGASYVDGTADLARVVALLDAGGRATGLVVRATGEGLDAWLQLARERGLRLRLHLDGPVADLDRLGGLGPDVHVTLGAPLSAADRALLRQRGAAVVLSVRGAVEEPPVADLLAEGSPVALGTGSPAPDLDLLAEAAACRDLALRQGAPRAGLAEALVRAATVGGATALGLAGPGVLAPGVRADLAVFDVPTAGDPCEALLDHGPGRCTATVLAGRLLHRRR